MEISNGWSLSYVDTEPLNVTMHNLMPSVLSSLRGREGGKQECRQKYRWLVLKSKEEKSFSLFFLKYGGRWVVRYPKNVCWAGLEN